MFGNQFKFSSVLKQPGYNDPVSAAVSVGGSLIGGAMQAGAAEDAAAMQAKTAADQMALQKQIFDIQNAQNAPYRATGYSTLNRLGSMLPGTYTQYDAEGKPIGTATGTDYLTRQFNAQDLNANLAPNYAWQLGQGQQATQNMANAVGGLVGGNALKAMQDYTQNFAGNAYQQAFSNYNTQRSNIYNTLASMAGIGQAAQGASNTLASNYGTNVGNLATGAAAAQAAGTVGAANAMSGALGNAGNMYSLSRMLGQGGGISNPFGNSNYYGADGSYFGPGALADTSGQYWSAS